VALKFRLEQSQNEQFTYFQQIVPPDCPALTAILENLELKLPHFFPQPQSRILWTILQSNSLNENEAPQGLVFRKANNKFYFGEPVWAAAPVWAGAGAEGIFAGAGIPDLVL
jgi:hypothetical protein